MVDAVIVAQGSDPHATLVGVQELTEWTRREDWGRILDNYARCVRITRKLERQFEVDPSRFEQQAEVELYAAYLRARTGASGGQSVGDFLHAFLPLVDSIDAYFARESGVLVMSEDLPLRENRLGQLQHIAALANGVVDLSRLEGF